MYLEFTANCPIFSWHDLELFIPANTGKDNNSNTAVTTTAQPNNANLCNLTPGHLMFKIVVMTPYK